MEDGPITGPILQDGIFVDISDVHSTQPGAENHPFSKPNHGISGATLAGAKPKKRKCRYGRDPKTGKCRPKPK